MSPLRSGQPTLDAWVRPFRRTILQLRLRSLRPAAEQAETLEDEWRSDFWMLTAQGQLGYIYHTMSVESVPSAKTKANGEYGHRIDRVIDYLRRNLDRPVKLAELADVACFSEFHVHRIFSAVSGETVNNFARACAGT